jgi:hypothetical protein
VSTAALPKERKRYNKKCTEITKNLSKLVSQYNLLVEQYNAIPHQQQPLQPTTLDAVKKQEFSWVNENAGEDVGQALGTRWACAGEIAIRASASSSGKAHMADMSRQKSAKCI